MKCLDATSQSLNNRENMSSDIFAHLIERQFFLLYSILLSLILDFSQTFRTQIQSMHDEA